jgi:hypothetical protein
VSGAPAAWLPSRPAQPPDREREGTWRSPGHRSSRLRAWIAVILLAAIVAVDLLGVWVDLRGVMLMADAEAGTLTEATAVAFDDLHGAVGILQVVLLIASGVAVLAWLSRVVDNVPPLTGHTPQRGPRAAIGWWFVPVANLVVPYMIVSDTARRLRHSGDRTGLVLPLWWTLWIASNVLSYLVARVPTDTIDQLRAVFGVFALGDLTDAVAGILLIVIVRRVETWSAVRASDLGVDRVAQPAWPTIGSVADPTGEPAAVAASSVAALVPSDGTPVVWPAAPASAAEGSKE